MSLHWSVIYYQITFKWHSGCGLEMSIVTCTVVSVRLNCW